MQFFNAVLHKRVLLWPKGFYKWLNSFIFTDYMRWRWWRDPGKLDEETEELGKHKYIHITVVVVGNEWMSGGGWGVPEGKAKMNERKMKHIWDKAAKKNVTFWSKWFRTGEKHRHLHKKTHRRALLLNENISSDVFVGSISCRFSWLTRTLW